MRTQPQPTWNRESCHYQPPDPTQTDVDRWNRADCGNGGKNQVLEMILASVFANGLSRYGSRHAFDQISMRDSPQNPSHSRLKSLPRAPDYYTSLLSNTPDHDAILPAPTFTDTKYVILRMQMQVAGYAWYTSNSSDYIAITVVVIYLLIPLAHTIWVVLTGCTSSSWDTITELLGLALQSPPSNALRGSGAGIERLGTYQRIVKLRARDKGQNKTVFLIIDEEGDTTNNQASKMTAVSDKRIEIDGEYI